MTTIAYWRGQGMASDTQITAGCRKLRGCKVRRLTCGGLLGGTGNWANILRVMRWAEAGLDAADMPDLIDVDEGGGFECLIVKGDGTVYLLDDDMELMPFTDEFIAVGSGGNYAVAAMHCGRSPADAVEVACHYDAGTSGPVEVWQLEAPKAAKPKPKAKIRGRKTV